MMDDKPYYVMKPAEKSLDTPLEFKKHLVDVHGTLQKDLSTDFTLATLKDYESEAVIEFCHNAFFCKKIAERIAKQHSSWEFKEGRWVEKPCTAEEIDHVNNVATSIFSSMMLRMYAMAVVTRNDKMNRLLELAMRENDKLVHDEAPDIDKDIKSRFLKNLMPGTSTP